MPNYLVSRIIIHCMNIESMAGQKFEEAFIHYNTAYRRLMFQYALKDFNNNLITDSAGNMLIPDCLNEIFTREWLSLLNIDIKLQMEEAMLPRERA